MSDVAAAFGAVPQHLNDAEDHGAIDGIGIRRHEDLFELFEVDGAGEQHRVVHADHPEHGSLEIGGDRSQRHPHDAALAVAVVEQRRVVEHRRPSARWNGGSPTSPLSASMSRPSTSWLMKPWLIRSTNVGKSDRSCRAATAVGMSSSLNPAHFGRSRECCAHWTSPRCCRRRLRGVSRAVRGRTSRRGPARFRRRRRRRSRMRTVPGAHR